MSDDGAREQVGGQRSGRAVGGKHWLTKRTAPACPHSRRAARPAAHIHSIMRVRKAKKKKKKKKKKRRRRRRRRTTARDRRTTRANQGGEREALTAYHVAMLQTALGAVGSLVGRPLSPITVNSSQILYSYRSTRNKATAQRAKRTGLVNKIKRGVSKRPLFTQKPPFTCSVNRNIMYPTARPSSPSPAFSRTTRNRLLFSTHRTGEEAKLRCQCVRHTTHTAKKEREEKGQMRDRA